MDLSGRRPRKGVGEEAALTKKNEINLDNPFNMPEFEAGEDEMAHALSAIVSTPEGRAFIWRILSFTKIYNEIFHGNSGDVFNKGKRSVGLWLIAQMTEIDPTIYPRMLLDVARQEQREQKRLATQEKDNVHNK